MINQIKLLRPEQVKDISDTILRLAVSAYLANAISKEEMEGITSYTAQLTALIRVLDEQGLIEH